MAPKKATAAAPAKKAAAAPSHASYKGELAAYFSTILSHTFTYIWMVVASIYWRVSADMIKDAILNVSWHCRAHTWSRHDLFVSSCAFNLHIQTQRRERESWRVFYHLQLKERNGSRSVVSLFEYLFLSFCLPFCRVVSTSNISLTHTFHIAVLPSRNIYWRTTNRLPLPLPCLIPSSIKLYGQVLRRAISRNQKVTYILLSLASVTTSPRDTFVTYIVLRDS